MKSIYSKNRVIGVLGGSFNPAHEGHLHISLYALNKLGLDSVWWLVSPQNPLKHTDDMADFEQRLQSAKALAQHPAIWVSDIERQQGLQYTYKTLAYLKQHYPGTHFIWMMGADNLVQFSRWQHWRKIIQLMPVIVFDRAPYSNAALHSQAYRYLHKFRIKTNDMHDYTKGSFFMYCHMKRSPLSSTHLRKTLGKRAFLGHNKNMDS
ncbi:MAG: nicotinate (nicotinamide) nucleotide adenylyltransferase [Alphaproteobacteria bacterium]